MKKIKLYIACSLDGKIAKANGDVRWLTDIPNPDNTDHDYSEFYESVDTTLMGHNTYEKITGFDIDFPYADKTNYVLTRKSGRKDTKFVNFISDNIVPFLGELKKKEDKDIWLVGGGELNTKLLNEGLIDEFIVFMMPVIIGSGIPLFGNEAREKMLQLTDVKKYSTGAVRLSYVESGKDLTGNGGSV